MHLTRDETQTPKGCRFLVHTVYLINNSEVATVHNANVTEIYRIKESRHSNTLPLIVKTHNSGLCSEYRVVSCKLVTGLKGISESQLTTECSVSLSPSKDVNNNKFSRPRPQNLKGIESELFTTNADTNDAHI